MEDKDILVCRYTELALRYSNIPRGTGWQPEHEEELKNLQTEMSQIRKELGIDK